MFKGRKPHILNTKILKKNLLKKLRIRHMC